MKIVVFIWELFVELISSLWDILISLFGFALSTAQWLHFEAPRFEGLLLGVLLAWLYVRRDRHPALRALGAPMKLILDVLDAVWDNAGDFLGGIKDATIGWLQQGYEALRSRFKRGWRGVLASLVSIRDRLRRDAK